MSPTLRRWQHATPAATPPDAVLRSLLSQNARARAANVPPRRINEIVLGKRGVSADTAVRLAATLGTSERFWLDLQADYDLEKAHRTLGKSIARIERIAT